MPGDTDALSVLESIRQNGFAAVVAADLLKAIYAIERDKQFEIDRGSVRASLRDLIEAAVPEETSP